jgi:hypothetical protein
MHKASSALCGGSLRKENSSVSCSSWMRVCPRGLLHIVDRVAFVVVVESHLRTPLQRRHIVVRAP